MARFGFVLYTDESFDCVDFDDEAHRAEVSAKQAAENVISIDQFRAAVERTFGPAEPQDAPEAVSAMDAAPASEALVGENFEERAEASDAGHLGSDPMPDPADTPTPDGQRPWHLELALWYVGNGMKIMPLTTDGIPLWERCYEKLIATEDEAREHWVKHPYCLIGVPAGANNLVIIDSDGKNGTKPGVTEFEKYVAEHGGIPKTPATITGSGGFHTFLKSVDGIKFKNSVGAFLPSNDVRAMNGYVVAQGVVKPDGKRYTVAPGTIPLAEAFLRGTIADIPKHLIDDLPKHDIDYQGADYQDADHDDAGHDDSQQTPPPTDGVRPSSKKPTQREMNHARGVLQGIVSDYEKMSNGSHRNAALNNAARRLGHHVKSGHLTYQEVYDALYVASRRNGYLAKDGHVAVNNTIRSGLTAGMREDARPPKDRSRDGAANGQRANTDKLAENLRQRAERERASGNGESDNTIRERQKTSESNTSMRHGVALFQLAHSKKITLRRAICAAWMFVGYNFLDDGDNKKVIEFAAPMTPDEAIDHLSSALPGLFTRAIVDAFKRGEYDDGRDDRAEYKESEQEPPRPKLEVINAASLAGVKFEPREWLVAGMIPHGTVTMMMGDGGVGKSTLALQLGVAVANDGSWIGLKPKSGGVIYLSAEDEVRDFHDRLLDMTSDLSLLHHLDIISLADMDATLAIPNRDGIMEQTAMFGAVEDVVIEKRPSLLVLDNLADVFGGDEIKKIQARGFIALLRRLAIQYNMTVLLLSHPSQSGMASGTGTSGNVAWNNSVRSRLYLERRFVRDGNQLIEEDGDTRILSVKKANYAKSGDQTSLRWESGVFVREREDARDEGDIKKKAERVFMTLLYRYLKQKRTVSHKPSVNYAPHIFASDDNSEGITKKQFAGAMNRLFDDEKIKVDVIGPPSRQTRSIVPNDGECVDRQYDDDEGVSDDNEDGVPWRRPK